MPEKPRKSPRVGMSPWHRRQQLRPYRRARLRITFTKVPTGTGPTIVQRDDGVCLAIRSAGPQTPVPHDLAHFVVESLLPIDLGLWGSVSAGAIFPGMRMLGGRRPPHSGERSAVVLKENHEQVLLAELVVGLVVNRLPRQFQRPGRARGVISGGGSADQMQRVLKGTESLLPAAWVPRIPNLCRGMTEMAERWRQVPAGGELTVAWEPSS